MAKNWLSRLRKTSSSDRSNPVMMRLLSSLICPTVAYGVFLLTPSKTIFLTSARMTSRTGHFSEASLPLYFNGRQWLRILYLFGSCDLDLGALFRIVSRSVRKGATIAKKNSFDSDLELYASDLNFIRPGEQVWFLRFGSWCFRIWPFSSYPLISLPNATQHKTFVGH